MGIQFCLTCSRGGGEIPEQYLVKIKINILVIFLTNTIPIETDVTAKISFPCFFFFKGRDIENHNYPHIHSSLTFIAE